ncbi:MAG: HEAT repeat domain-containing protein, partial [Ignavibacteria bacterium]|nr:HEAT repeat domain-containing protein [Ignavibacteria bacterium]
QKLMNTNAEADFWKKYIKDESDPIRCLAINKISERLKNKFEKDLVKIYNDDISPNVRMTVLKCLAELRSQTFEKILLKSINDPNEYIRRISIQWMGELARDEYLEPIVKATLLDESDRIPFKGKSVLPLMGIKKSLESSIEIIDKIVGLENKDKLKEDFSRSLKRSEQWLHDELLPTIKSDTVKLRKRISDARTFRNYTFEDAVEELIALAKDTKIDGTLRSTIIEALGWYYFSPKRFEIIKACDEIILSDIKNVSDEALRTRNRLIEGANNPITP